MNFNFDYSRCALKSLLAKFQPSLCNDVPAWVLKILYRVNVLMVRTEFYSWSESTAYVTVSVPAKYCNHLFYGTVDGIHIHFFYLITCRWVHRRGFDELLGVVDGSIVSMGPSCRWGPSTRLWRTARSTTNSTGTVDQHNFVVPVQ